MITVRNWRIQEADPRGCTMWFDPDREAPMLCSLSTVSEEPDYYEGGAFLEVSADTSRNTEGVERVPDSGDATKTSEIELDELPF